MNKVPWMTIGLALLTLGSARGDSASAPLVNNFSGTTCPSPYPCNTYGAPDGDLSFRRFFKTGEGSNTTGWLPFGSTNNPLPTFLTGIDPNFDTRYQVDSISITLKTLFGQGLLLELGDGAGTIYTQFTLGATNATFNNGNIKVNELIVPSSTPGFDRALTNGFMFKLTKPGSLTQIGTWLYNTRVYIHYSEKPISTVPDESSTLILALGVLGVVVLSRIKKPVFRFKRV